MKIAQLIYSLTAGGAETLVKELSHELNNQGHEVTVLLLDRFKNTAYEKEALVYLANVGVHVISLERKPGSIGVKTFYKLLQIMKVEKYDILHSHLAISDIMSWFLCEFFFKNTQHVSTIHNSVIYQESMVAKIWQYCQKRTTTVFCSQAAMEANEGMLRQTKFIQNGSSSEKYGEVKELRWRMRSSLGITSGAPLIINVGRIVKQKNQLVLLEAMQLLKKSLPGIQCIICGDGEDRKKLERFLDEQQLNDTVHFLGIRNDIVDLLMVSDVFVSTSIHEGLPITVLEAFFAGLSCVLSPIKEHIDIAKGVVGVSVAEGNTADAIAKEIYSFISSERPDKSDVQKQRKAVLQPYSIANCARKYLELYGELM